MTPSITTLLKLSYLQMAAEAIYGVGNCGLCEQ